MAKKLDENTILNELRGGSAFFPPSPTVAEELPPQRVVVESKKGVKQPNTEGATPRQLGLNDKHAGQPVEQSADQSVGRPSNASIRPSLVQPTDSPDGQPTRPSSEPQNSQLPTPSVDRLTSDAFDRTPVMPKDKAFYITERQDEDLNLLVKKLAERVKGRVSQKLDRSVVMRLILECTDLTNDATVDRLAKQLVKRLASQLASQLDDL